MRLLPFLLLICSPVVANNLWQAARANDSSEFRRLLPIEADLNARDPKTGSTALGWAAYAGNAEMVAALVERHADLNARDNSLRTPMHDAASLGRINVAQLMIDAGARFDERDENGQTPLMIAARNNQLAFAQLLLNNGADGRCVVAQKTIAQWVAENGSPEMHALFIANWDLINSLHQYAETKLPLVSATAKLAFSYLWPKCADPVEQRDAHLAQEIHQDMQMTSKRAPGFAPFGFAQ